MKKRDLLQKLIINIFYSEEDEQQLNKKPPKDAKSLRGLFLFLDKVNFFTLPNFRIT